MRILLLDDNRSEAERISEWLGERFSSVEFFCYHNAFSFVSGIYDELKGEADLMLIHLKDDQDEYVMLAHDIQNYFPQLKLIFFSEHDIFADTIYKALPIYFFRLPMEEEAVLYAFERIIKEIGNDNDHSLQITKNRKIIKIPFEAINYIESFGRKILLYSDIGYFEANMSMQEVLSRLPDHFLQCHRSYIINARKVSHYDSFSVGIKGKDIIPVSKTYRDRLKDVITRGENKCL